MYGQCHLKTSVRVHPCSFLSWPSWSSLLPPSLSYTWREIKSISQSRSLFPFQLGRTRCVNSDAHHSVIEIPRVALHKENSGGKQEPCCSGRHYKDLAFKSFICLLFVYIYFTLGTLPFSKTFSVWKDIYKVQFHPIPSQNEFHGFSKKKK